MNDKNLMQNILLLEKSVCDLYMHGTIESGTENVHQTFQTALNASLNIQDDIYNKMMSKGWYTAQQVEQNKIQNLKQKYNNCQCSQ